MQELEAREKGLSTELAINDAVMPLPARPVLISHLIARVMYVNQHPLIARIEEAVVDTSHQFLLYLSVAETEQN